MLQHELDTADRIATLGHDVVFRPVGRNGSGNNADVMINGETWDFKSPTSAARGTVAKRVIDKANKQGGNVVLDLTRSSMSYEDGIALVNDLQRRYPERLKAGWVIKKVDDTVHSVVIRGEEAP